MASTAALISVSEYLNTSYRPDCDYIDGQVLERNLGETPHSGLQIYLAMILRANRNIWNIRPYTEQRVQISEKRFRIPDICAMRPGDPPGPILRTAPLLCIEIYSPRDTARTMQDRIDDYLALGVPNIWLIDPARRLAWTADPNGQHPLATEAFTIEHTPIQIPLADLWAELDDIAAGR